ncbi:MAG: hypothetical protein Q8O09_06170 [Bacillota bacterium]|nr:hypothetical protein [Bacillota bacterium]
MDLKKGAIKMNRKLLIIPLIILIISSFVGCATAEINEDQTVIKNSFASKNAIVGQGLSVADEENTRYISNSASRIKSYDTLESLQNAAPFIFTGTCISSKPVFQKDTLYTLSTVKITNVFKGNLTAGDTVLIVENGGRTTFGEYEKGCNIEPKAFETGERLPADYKIVEGTDGYFPMKENEEMLLFVGDTSGFLKDVSEPLYDIMGAYDGKLHLQKDGSYAKPKPSSTDKHMFGEGTLTITLDELEALK